MKYFVKGLIASAALTGVLAGAQVTAQEPVRGGTLVTVLGSNVRNLNPAVQSGIVTGYPGAQLFASPSSAVPWHSIFPPAPRSLLPIRPHRRLRN